MLACQPLRTPKQVLLVSTGFIRTPRPQLGFTKVRSISSQKPLYDPNTIVFPPYRGHCVTVSVINGATTHMLSRMLVHRPLENQKYLRLADYSFLVESQNRQRKVLFDLAFMENMFDRMPPALKAMFSSSEEAVMKIDHVCDVPSTLQAHGIELSTINDIIWSHSHIDHVGDPSVFPSTTRLVVGPGFKNVHMPGYPTRPDGFVLDSAFTGRQVEEVNFSAASPVIGGFRAFDFFQDGSFWLLECPGHTGHHIGALGRTTEASWVFIGADCCHHAGQLRPSPHRLLPPHLTINEAATGSMQPCLCSQLLSRLREQQGNSLYELSSNLQEDVEKAQETLEKLRAFDARDDVLVMLAHDPSFLDVIDFFPQNINHWKKAKWAEKTRWMFLNDGAKTTS
ncbi:Hypothetical protein R9X50_00415000 [Acrodontium crateriforme]|uniref:Metallo-beta-lactamase domain-containing protein n=1 Tax=Acrodontium crateriforme TaxID=150365 RepID=A0AAQ3R4U3_9PEZI|nr:Hypothetical protein R9X50_00415000 [Acrodontium crateriforme]